MPTKSKTKKNLKITKVKKMPKSRLGQQLSLSDLPERYTDDEIVQKGLDSILDIGFNIIDDYLKYHHFPKHSVELSRFYDEILGQIFKQIWSLYGGLSQDQVKIFRRFKSGGRPLIEGIVKTFGTITQNERQEQTLLSNIKDELAKNRNPHIDKIKIYRDIVSQSKPLLDNIIQVTRDIAEHYAQQNGTPISYATTGLSEPTGLGWVNELYEEDQGKVLEELVDSYNIKGSGIGDSIKGFFRKVGNVFSNSYSPTTEKAVKKWGQLEITKAMIYRAPIDSSLKKVIGVLSLGKFQENVHKDFDDVYHLAMILEMVDENGNHIYVLTEKRPNIEFNQVKDIHDFKGTSVESIEVVLPKSVIFRQTIEETMKRMGNKFHDYNPINNNCQFWILNLVESMYNLDSRQIPTNLRDFIYQDAKILFKDLASVGKIVTGVTSLGHFFGRLQGKGILKQGRETQRKVRRQRGGQLLTRTPNHIGFV